MNLLCIIIISGQGHRAETMIFAFEKVGLKEVQLQTMKLEHQTGEMQRSTNKTILDYYTE
jgi:hypothetical protein